MRVLDEISSKALTRYVLNSRESLITEKTELDKLSFVTASKQEPSKRYGIAVRYRNIPVTETRSQVFEDSDLSNIEAVCMKNNLIPAISFVLYDDRLSES